jgi:DNA-binding NtrC family response regulator
MDAPDAPPRATATDVLGPVPLPLHEAVTAFKRRLVEDALARHGGNRSRAAAALGIERTSLLRIIRELGIEGPPGQPGRPSSSASVVRARAASVEVSPTAPRRSP